MNDKWRVRAEWDEDVSVWVLTVPGVGVTQKPCLCNVPEYVADYLTLMLDQPISPEHVEVTAPCAPPSY